MTFAEQILHFYKDFKPNWKLPNEVELIFPYKDKDVMAHMTSFYTKFYNDKKKRCILFGINPGRLGAGTTGVPFTDPIRLQADCLIPNDIRKKQELSSVFIYEMINQFKSVKAFYNQIYISSICPIGFIKDGKNYNYYDSKDLYNAVESKIIKAIEEQLKFPVRRDKSFSLGKGKNYKVLKNLNDKFNWFEEVIPLPHPRWVMQYKLKTKQVYLDEYFEKLSYLF